MHLRSNQYYEEHRICFTNNPPEKFGVEFYEGKLYVIEHHFDIDEIRKQGREQFMTLTIGHLLEMSGMLSLDVFCIDKHLKETMK